MNLTGLTVSFTAGLFIFLYIQHELSFDRFHRDASNMYRIALTLKFNELSLYTPAASAPLGAALRDQLPEVTESLRLYGLDVHHTLRYGDKAFTERRVLYADSNFFSFFSFALTEGDIHTSLEKPGSIVITRSLAEKYFGNEAAVGKLMLVDGESFTVTGIAEEPPSNSHIVFDALISMSTFKPASGSSWMGNRFMTYIKLTDLADLADVEQKLDNLVARNIGPDLENSLGISFQEFLKQSNKIGYDLHPLTKTHLYSKFPRDLTPAGDIVYVYVLGSVGLALLVIACFNFMNLSTAQFGTQIKAVSIRKVLGATRLRLATNLMLECFLLCLTASIISWLALYVLLPFSSSISGKPLEISALISFPCLGACLAMISFATILSASYPTFFLTSIKPVEALRGRTTGGLMAGPIRTALIVSQYTLAMGLIAFTWMVLGQLDYISSFNLGVPKNNIVALRNIDRLGSNAVPLKNSLLTETGIVAASFTDRTLFEKMSGEAVRIPNNPQSHIMSFYVSDEDQLKVMNFKLIAGRFFSKDFPSDSNAVVINRAAMRDMGWTDVESREFAADADIRYKVVGVVEDFNYESLRSEIKPLLIFYNPHPGNTLTIRFDGISPSQLIRILEAQWQRFGNSEPFEYNFLDQDFDTLFRTEARVANLLTLFSIGIILIASLGLFALSSFTAEKRRKEIGIRKVLGASAGNIVSLLGIQFIRLVGIAFLISLVPTYLMTRKWLEGFAYHIEVDYVPFLMAGVTAVFIALVTIAYHSIKSASINPANTLRSE